MAFVDDHSESIAATTGTTGSFQNQTDVVIVCKQSSRWVDLKRGQTKPFHQTTMPNVPAK